MTNKALDNLKALLEGKTILAIDPPMASEAICKITLTDGTAFRLHATELGFWTEETVASGQKYRSLTGLFLDVGNHQYGLSPEYEYETPDPKVTLDGQILRVEAVDGKTFEADLGHFNPWERKVCAHPEATQLLTRACTLGDMWTMVFAPKSEDCPAELRLSEG